MKISATLALLFASLFLFFSQPVAAQSGAVNDFALEDLDGNTHRLSQYLEKGPVYISFWAMWCQPCLHKMRLLTPLHKKYAEQGFTLLAINTDDPNSLSRVRSYISAQRYDFPVLLDPDERVFEQFNGRSLPFAVMVDTNGRVVQTDVGFLPGDEVKIGEKIEELLNPAAE